MDYILNETPVRTSVNYGINNIKLDLEIPPIRDFMNYAIMSYDTDEFQITDLYLGNNNVKMNSKIGLEVDKNFGLTITIPKNTKIKNQIIFDFTLDEDNLALVDNIKIVYEENSQADVTIKYRSDDDGIVFFNSDETMILTKHFHYLKQETIANKNSKGSITIINEINKKSDSFIAIENTLNENADIQYNLIEIGGNRKISNYYAKLVGDNSKNVVKNIYVGTNENIVDINYNIDILGKNAYCNIESQGALTDYAKKNFKGTINFAEGSKKSVGIENENCMLLSENAKSKSLPMLLCHEEDVKGEHGVATGKPDEKKLFYIMTKGISETDARMLITKANFDHILDEIYDEHLRAEIDTNIEQLLRDSI